MTKKIIIPVLLLLIIINVQAAENPKAVSPGHKLRMSVVHEVCPTFSWTQIPDATAYQIAVFKMNDPYEGLSYYENQAVLSRPVIIKDISGPATSWTPSIEESLQNGGRYVWFVQALDAYGSSTWSMGKKFAVRAPMGLNEIKEKVKKELESRGVKGEVVDQAFQGIQSQATQLKSGGELKSKTLPKKEKEGQAKAKKQGIKKIGSKKNQITEETTDRTANALGSEGDAGGNVYYGVGSGYSLTSGAGANAFFGLNTGYNTDYGDNNVFVGYRAGYTNTSGSYNTYVGYEAGFSNSTGEFNAFVGTSAGRYNIGDGNVFMGYYTGHANYSGHSNTFIGYRAGRNNYTGYSNTFMGWEAGFSNSSGDENTFLGDSAGYTNTGNMNTFIGVNAGASNTTASSNAFFGKEAGYSNTTGAENTFMGTSSGYSNGSGNENTLLGYQAGYSVTGSGNVFLGSQAGYNEIGSSKLYIENSSSTSPLIYGEFDNDFVKINGDFRVTGYLSLDNGVTQIGSAEINLLDGMTSVATGSSENDKLVTKGYVDTYDDVGGGSGNEGDAYYNVYFGSGAGNSLTSSANSNGFFGYQTGYNTTSGDENTFIGDFSGYNNSTGSFNTFVGRSAGEYSTEGAQNTFVGNNSGYHNTTGDVNTCVGAGAGFSNETGEGNVFLGNEAGYYETGSNKLYIENSFSTSPLIYGEFDNDLVNINGQLNVVDGGYLGLTGSTNQITIDTTSSRARFKLQADGGGTNTDDFFNFTMRNDYGDVTLSVRDSSAAVWLPMLSYEYLNNKVDFKDNDIVTTGTISSGGGAYTSGGAWIEASSRDYKENISELDRDESIQALEHLNPVRYNYKNKKDEEFLGFIAEDVPDLVAMNGRKGMRAMDIVAVLTKVVQDQQKTIDEQKDKNIMQDKALRDQSELLKKQNKLINELKERIKEIEKESQ